MKLGAFEPILRIDRMFLNCFVSIYLTQWVLKATFDSSENTLVSFLISELDRVAPFPKCGHSLFM